jgi:RNA polymerase sigma-70 factor (ECF subfamily)
MGRCDEQGSSASDADRFDRLYRRHAEQILRYCLRRTGDPAVAEDIRSEVFYEAWRRRNDVDLATRPALPWLYGVAANLLRNHVRASRRRQAAFRRLALPRDDPDVWDLIADQLDASERASVVVELLNALPAGERRVVLLCLVNDLSYEAAARALGLPIGTVRSRLSRARTRLRGFDRTLPGGGNLDVGSATGRGGHRGVRP